MDRKYKDYKEIQETYGQRNYKNFDYYDADNVCVIHFKFGNAWKLVTGLKLENNLTMDFIEEYKKYWEGKGDKIKTARDLVNYVKEHNLPVIFYANFYDEEMNSDNVEEWLSVNAPEKN